MLVSVIIPAFNRAKYIEAAIQSVVDQEPFGGDMEIIVVDDGSTDNTAELVAKFPQVRYTKIPNSGRPAVPRNVGLRQAKGNLIAFQDSDDLWVKNKLAAQLPAFLNPEIGLAYGNADIMSAEGILSGTTVIEAAQALNGGVFDDLALSNVISTLTVIVRREVLDRVGNFNESFGLRGVEDYQLWLRVAADTQIQFVNQTLAYYRKHDQNISTSDTKTSLLLQLHIFRSLLKLKFDNAKLATLHKRAADIYFGLVGHATSQLERKRWQILGKIHHRLAKRRANTR